MTNLAEEAYFPSNNVDKALSLGKSEPTFKCRLLEGFPGAWDRLPSSCLFNKPLQKQGGRQLSEMGCTHSKGSKEGEHRRKLKIKEVLESSTQDPNNILKMNELEQVPAPILDASSHHDGPDGAIRLTKASMEPRKHPARAFKPEAHNTASSSGSTEEIWAKLHQPQTSESKAKPSSNHSPMRNDARLEGSQEASPRTQQLPLERMFPESINSPHKGRDAAPSQRKGVDLPSYPKDKFKPVGSRQATKGASPSRPSQMQAHSRRAEAMYVPPMISFKKASGQSSSRQPMGTEQAFGIQSPGTSNKNGSRRMNKAASHDNKTANSWAEPNGMHDPNGPADDDPAVVIPNPGDERVHGGRWHRKLRPESPIQDSISNRQVSSLSIGSGPSASDGPSIILDTQHFGSNSADSTPRLMMDSPGSHAHQGVTVLGSPVKQPHMLFESTRDTSFTISFRASYETKG
ncbi:hypothetical protein WJX74_011109 [Apatococcus lobatus]|uniref:Uncharacterized protein n=1 Tax=Apatococcus lobatus TaxID=904363 RepID=A0AAW1QAD4_9CHLO